MPQTTTVPTIAPTTNPTPLQEPELLPHRICPQQTREAGSPDVSP